MRASLTFSPVPRSLRWVSVVCLIMGVGMVFVGGWEIGVTTDEPYHVQRFNNYLETGWYIVDAQRYGDVPGKAVSDQYVYGPATMLLLHGLGALAGVDTLGAAASTPAAYAVRHLGIGLLSVVGLLAVAAVTRLLTRRWDWGLVCAAVLAVLPMWTGHSMFNLKDVPVATGYATVTLGLILLTRWKAGRWHVRVASPLCICAGTLLSVGTRPGMWAALFASAVTLIICLLLRSDGRTWRRRVAEDRWRYGELGVGFIAAAIGLLLIYPKVFSSPVEAFARSAASSANFLGMESSRFFVPTRVVFLMPSLLLAFAGLGLVIIAFQIVAARLRPTLLVARLCLVLVQMLTLPVYAIAQQTSLYGDLRQLLFSAPATVIVATVGMAWLFRRAQVSKDRHGPPMVAAAACVALIAPAIDQAALFPYNYAYYNALSAVAGVPIYGDYYRASARELVRHLPKEGRLVCSSETDEAGHATRMAHLDGFVDCAEAQASPVSAFAANREWDAPALEEEGFWIVSFDAEGDVPQNCRKITGIRTGTFFHDMHAATLSRCTLEFPTVGLGTMAVTARKTDVELLDRGWFTPSLDGTQSGARSMGDVASITFRFAKQLSGKDVTITVGTSAPSLVSARLAGHSLKTEESSLVEHGFDIAVPRALVTAVAREPKSLVFTSVNSRPLDIEILSLTVREGITE